MILIVSEAQEKEALTLEELVQEAFKNFKGYRWHYRSITKRTITREFIETVIEDAEEIEPRNA